MATKFYDEGLGAGIKTEVPGRQPQPTKQETPVTKPKKSFRFGLSKFTALLSSGSFKKVSPELKKALVYKQPKQFSVKKPYSNRPTSNSNLDRLKVRQDQNRQKALELALRRSQDNQISENTAQILARIRAVQNKSASDDSAMRRRLRERQLIQDATNLLNTPNIFKERQSTFNPLDDSQNILRAPNAFRRENSTNIMDTKGRPTIMQAPSLNWGSVSTSDDLEALNIFSKENAAKHRLKF